MLAQIARCGILAAGLACLGGCSNALLFYETGKISLTIEGRPDSSQPVQGNIGFKQRTAVVAPPKADTSKKDTAKDAGAMISSFRFEKKNEWLGWGPINIQTALVTGEAARLSTPEAQRVAAAVANLEVPPYSALAERGIGAATVKGQEARLRTLAAKNWSDLTDADKAELGKLTDSGENYSEAFHDAIREQLTR